MVSFTLDPRTGATARAAPGLASADDVPDDPSAGSGALSTGRNDYGTVLNAPIIEEKLAGKFSFFRNNDEGAWRNEARGGSRGYGDRIYSWVGELLFTPNEQLDVLVKYEKGEDDTDSGPLLNIAGPGELQCAVGVPLDGFQTFCGLQAGNEKTTQNHTNDIHATLDAVTVRPTTTSRTSS